MFSMLADRVRSVRRFHQKAKPVAKPRSLRCEPLEQRALLSLTVSLPSGKTDFAPGETVLIQTSGISAGDQVCFQVLNQSGNNSGPGHTPWAVADGSAADLDGVVNGSVTTSWYVNPANSIGQSFLLVARDVATGEQATTAFTDGPAAAVSVSASLTNNTCIVPGDFITRDGRLLGETNGTQVWAEIEPVGTNPDFTSPTSPGAATPVTIADGLFQYNHDILPDGAYTAYFWAADSSGNWTQTPSTVSFTLETVAPTLTATISSPGASPVAGVTGAYWYNVASGPATIAYTASDPDNLGLWDPQTNAPVGPSGLPLTWNYSFQDGVGNGHGQSITGIEVEDLAGNWSSPAGAYSGIFQDTQGPVLTGTISSPGNKAVAGVAGDDWYNIASGPATVRYSVGPLPDYASLTQSPPQEYIFADGADLSHTVTVTDQAGNSSSFTSSGIYQDTVAPTLAATINSPDASTGWYNVATGPAVITYTTTDASPSSEILVNPKTGAVQPSPYQFTYTFVDGSDMSHQQWVRDAAGNRSNTVTYANIYQDTVAPVLTAAISHPGTSPVATPAGTDYWQADWYNIASGAATITYSVGGLPPYAIISTPQTFSYVFPDGNNLSSPAQTVTDQAGNTSNSVQFSGIYQDTVAPTVASISINHPGTSPVTTPAGSDYWQTDWYNNSSGAAVMTVDANDPNPSSGLPINPVTYLFPDGADESSQAVTVYDTAGNSVTVAAGYYTGVYQDTVVPSLTSITISHPDGSPVATPAGNNYWQTDWYNIASGPAVITVTAGDAGPGGPTVIQGTYQFPDGADLSSQAVTVSDAAGNSLTVPAAYYTGIYQDTVAPVLSATINSPDASTGWYNKASGPAVVTYIVNDLSPTSGIVDPNTGAVAPPPYQFTYIFSDGIALSHSQSVYDAAGNPSNTVTYSGIDQDTVAPRVTVSINCPGESAVASPAGSNYWQTDWYNIASAPAVMTVAAIDATPSSGLPVNPVTYTFPDGANESSQAVTVYDEAGNSVTVASGYYSGIYQDTVAPVLSGAINSPNASTGWYNKASGPAVVTYTVNDLSPTSGIVDPNTAAVESSPYQFTYTFSDGKNLSHSQFVYDVAGNQSNIVTDGGISQDTVVPTVTSVSIGIPGTSPVSTPAGNSYWQTDWYNIASGAAVITVTVGDNAPSSGLPVNPTTYTFPDGADESSPAITIYDKAGNSVTVPAGYFTGIYQDTAAPTITTVSISHPTGNPVPAGAGNYWQDNWYIDGEPAVITINASDPSPSSALPVNPVTYTFPDGVKESSPAISMYDNAGNSVTLPAGYFTGVCQDTVAPTVTSISISTPGTSPVATPAGNNYWQTDWYNIASGPAVMTVTASDANPSSGLPVNPTTYTFPDGANESSPLITVNDAAGNSITVPAGYFTGIYQDTAAPTITSVSISHPTGNPVPPGTGNYWQNNWYIDGEPAVITVNAGDPGPSSGLPVDPVTATLADGKNESSPAIVVYDAAGNSVTVPAGYYNGINQDTAAPVLNPAQQVVTYDLGSIPLATPYTPSSDYSNAPAPVSSRTINPDPGANDALSGLDTIRFNAAWIDTTVMGATSFTETATDVAGNRATAQFLVIVQQAHTKVTLVLPPGFTAPTSGQTTDTNADTGFNLAATVKDTDDLSTLVNEGSVDFVIEDSHGSVVAEHDGVAVQNGVANDTNEFYLPAGIGYQVVADYVLASTPHFYTSSSAARHFDLSFGDSTAAPSTNFQGDGVDFWAGFDGAQLLNSQLLYPGSLYDAFIAKSLNMVDQTGKLLPAFSADPKTGVGALQLYLESAAGSNNMSQFLSIQMAVAQLNVLQSKPGDLGGQYVDAASLLPFIGASDSQPIASSYITASGYITLDNLIVLANRLVSTYSLCQQNGVNSAAYKAEAAIGTLLAAANLDASVYLQFDQQNGRQDGELTWD